ncbi:MAG TPA: penicillin acylase family protein, partial [Roseiarcus sp.]|nr:penicillin acylase family protein [Roseiarcus sp.]
MRRRLLVGGLKFAAALVAVAAIASVYVFWRAMPVYSGAQRLPGLSSEVRVWRDAHGVPHIFAASMSDAARALGYIHASERLFQMELNRRVGQGRVAEILGPDFVNVDRYMRTLGYYREAQNSFDALSPWAQNRLVAYAEGVNAFLDSHTSALPPEFLVIGDTPEPWTAADSLVWGKVMAQQLSHNYALESLRARLRDKLGAERAGWLFPGTPPGAPITTMPALGETHAADDPIEDEIGGLTGLTRGASNEWVVSGMRTATGKPILANDPHLGLEAP